MSREGEKAYGGRSPVTSTRPPGTRTVACTSAGLATLQAASGGAQALSASTECEASRSASCTPASSAIGSHAQVCGSRAMCFGSNVHTRSPVSRPRMGGRRPGIDPVAVSTTGPCGQRARLAVLPDRGAMTASSTSYQDRAQGEVDAGPQRRGRCRARRTTSGGDRAAGGQRWPVSTDAPPLPAHNAMEARPSRAAASGTAHATAVSPPPDRPGVLTVARVRGPDVAR